MTKAQYQTPLNNLLSACRLIALVCVMFCLGMNAKAQNFERMSDLESELYGENAYVSGDYETMKNVRKYWQQEVQRLKSMRQMEFNLTGSNDAVLKVSIPSRMLFNQNDTTLTTSAEGSLRPFLRLLRGDQATATLIIAVSTDNNGSDRYLQKLSTSRANAIHRWFARQGVGPADLHSFGLGNRVPHNENSNIKERERNRRVYFYFVPNKKLLKNAKKGNI